MAVKSPYPKSVYENNARIYKMLGNPKRLEILNIIKNNEVTVDELSSVIGIRKANTSQHLTILRHLRIVTVRREGKNAYYKLANPKIVETCKILRSLWKGESL